MKTDFDRFTEAIRAMEESISQIDSRLTRVEQALVEQHDAAPPERSFVEPPPATPLQPAQSPGTGTAELGRQSLVSLIGRSLIVISGAYLLRALTESGAFPLMIGALGGLAYATAFVMRAFQQASSARMSATFHGVTATLIAMPLTVETAVRFKEMRVDVAYIVLLTFAGVVAVISTRAKLQPLAWCVQSITFASLIALLVGSRSFSLGMLSILVAAIGSMSLANQFENRAFIIPPAALSSLLAIPLVNLGLVERAPPGAAVAIVTLLAFVAVWIGIVMADARRHPERPGFLLLAHIALVLLLGTGGSLYVASHMSLEFLFAPICAAIAVATGIYASRMVMDAGDRDRRSVTFVTLTSLLIMAVTVSVLGPMVNAITWLVLAAVSFLLARSGHRLLYESSTLLIVGAAWGSGLFRWVGESLVTIPDPSDVLPSAAAVVILGASLVFLLTADPPTGGRGFHRWVINTATTVIIVGGAFGFGIHLLQMSLPLLGWSAHDAGAVASARTIVLSIGAIVLAWLARYPRSRTIGSLVNIVLILAAVLIVLVNVRVGRAATHFPAFSVYGVALIVAPTLKRKSLSLRTADENTASEEHTVPAST